MICVLYFESRVNLRGSFHFFSVLTVFQDRRETEIRMRRNREMRERERREIRRFSGWRDWKEAVPGPWCPCSLDEVINMLLFCVCPLKKINKSSFLALLGESCAKFKRLTAVFRNRKTANRQMREKERMNERKLNKSTKNKIKLLMIPFSKLQLLQFCPLPIVTSLHTPF